MRKRKKPPSRITRQVYLTIWARIGRHNGPKWVKRSIFTRLTNLGYPQPNAKIY